MKERFKSYLEQAFRKIRPTKAAMEYRLETLTKLEEAAQDYRIKGMTDDEAIYQLCIDSLGDFDAKLQEFDRNLTEVPKKNNLKRNIAVGAIGSVAAIIALYLILSLTGAVGWGMSWLILLGAVVAAVVAVDVVLMLKAFKDDKFLVARLFNVGTVILVFVFMYLCIHLSVHPGYDWYIFLCMVPAAGIMDIAIGFVTKSKLTIPEIFVWAMLTSVMLYVMLGVAGVMAWHPGWLLPALTAIAIVAIVASLLISRSKKAKKDRQIFLDSTQNQVDEEYYTKW